MPSEPASNRTSSKHRSSPSKRKWRGRWHRWNQKILQAGFHYVRRVVVFVLGGTVLLIGIAMTVLPGPAIVVIPLGLGILALEFRWARRLLKEAKAMIQPQRHGEQRPRNWKEWVERIRIAFRRSFGLGKKRSKSAKRSKPASVDSAGPPACSC